ncbi:MAG: phosphorylase kinase [Desulfatitalea sp.]|nr:phosphorylase kinase [Desulfatitalea sp.]MBI5894796.1 phosphorylase kinase [Desulfobacterales bacterium]
MLVIRNEALLEHIRPSYRREDVRRLFDFLNRKGTFEFQCLPNGLFPASAVAAENDASGYQNAWVRDNVHIAHAHFVWGERAAATQTAQALMRFFQGQRPRMQRIVQRPSLAADPMQRPHVRFDARRIEELAERWPHAQNDALGYFLWFFSKMAAEGLVELREEALTTLADLVFYLHAIQYWRDRDSGHWEEARKISASSIGTVLAGLRAFAGLCAGRGLYTASSLAARRLDDAWMSAMIATGERELHRILPWESLGPAPAERRRYDAALLFLIYPLEIVSGPVADRILTEVTTMLGGPMGIRRYLLDSYWFADYRARFSANERSADFSQAPKERDSHIRPGEEAQWCLFDPIIACIYGARWAKQPAPPEELRLQSHYLNRALGQLTEEKGGIRPWQCPEAYFLEDGAYVPNDNTPLQWTQANLKMALHWIETTAAP